jgi:hypothetical protein
VPGVGPGQPQPAERNLVRNGDFRLPRLVGWAVRREVRDGKVEFPEGEVLAGQGRDGTGALHIGPATGGRGRYSSVATVPDLRHADFFLDGYARFRSPRGTAWVGIEFVFEDPEGGALATYLAWKGTAGCAAPKRDGGLVEEMSDAGGGWWRVPSRTSHDLRLRGLFLSARPSTLSVRLLLDLEEAEAEAWFDDVQVIDMKANR